MPRPTGKGAAELDDAIANGLASGKLKPRAGHNAAVRVRRVKPSPRSKSAKPASGYAGLQSVEKECRRDGCDVVFMPTAPAAAYCSLDCRDEAIRAQRRRTDRGKRKRARERQQRGAGPIKRTCALDGCDREFVPEHPRSSYCSQDHRNEATQIIKARARARERGEEPAPMVTSATRQAIDQINAAATATGDGPVALDAAEYIGHLWNRVQEDPDCPQHVFDRLERLLGVTDDGSTITP